MSETPIKIELGENTQKELLATLELQPPRKLSKLEITLDILSVVAYWGIFLSLLLLIAFSVHGDSPFSSLIKICLN